jgi:hypothetical protein
VRNVRSCCNYLTCNTTPCTHTSTDHQNTGPVQHNPNVPACELPDQIQLKHSRNLKTLPLIGLPRAISTETRQALPIMISRPTSQTPSTSAEPDNSLLLLRQESGCSRNPTEYQNPSHCLANRRQHSSKILISLVRCRSRGSHTHHTISLVFRTFVFSMHHVYYLVSIRLTLYR